MYLKLRSRLTPAILLASVLLFPQALLAQAQTQEKIVRVAARTCPPFVMNNAGEFTGLSIFLWEQMAKKVGLEYRIDEYKLDEMLNAVSEGRADLGVSCLSVTEAREKIVDFSHSFYETNLAIAAKQRGYLDGIKKFFQNRKVLTGIGLIAAAAALIGGIIFWLEHTINPKLFSMKSRGGKLMEAFIVGLLFVTRGPIRYYEFRTPVARMLSAVLAVFSTLMIASMTALLASAFTIEHLRTEIAGPQDLSRVRVGAMETSTSSQYLQRHGIAHRTFGDRQQLFAALDGGHLDAVVSDAAVLKYTIKKAKEEGRYATLAVLPYEFDRQNYGFALQDNSPHLEAFNQALLAARTSPEWERELAKYLGQ